MTYAEQLAVERKARLVRLGAERPAFKNLPPKKVNGIDPSPFYRQMWMWDLVSPAGEPAQPKVFKFAAVVDAVCRHFLIARRELLSKRMSADVVYPRQICYWLVWQLTDASSMRIGLYFDRDHATILHGQKKIRRLIREDWRVAYDIAHLEAIL